MQLTIAHRYCGPPESGNGGWVSGAVAAHVTTSPARPAVTVRLGGAASARPPARPRAEPASADGGAAVRLLDGDHLVATAVAASDALG